MSRDGKWGDLATRVASAIVLAIVGFGAVWMGGWVFVAFVATSAGLIVWELIRMLAPEQERWHVPMGIVSGVAVVLASLLPLGLAVGMLCVPVVAGIVMVETRKRLFVPFLLYILLACLGMLALRSVHGVTWIGWLVMVVVVTDVAGYFAGRLFGGPKFWPAISPKKTWSGTVAGWIGAGIVGAIFMALTGAGSWLILLSMITSLASQMGDIAESAIKRRAGIKDSSNLIPGHGGLFDRFDGMLAASVLTLAVIALTKFPPGSL